MTALLSYRVRIAFLICLLSLALPGHSAPRQRTASEASSQHLRGGTSPAQTSADRTYVIGDGDLLGINVWNEPDFKQSLPVRPDGRITLPLIGSVQAAGRTPVQLENTIVAMLLKYIRNPNVTVMVLQINSRNFNVLGRVAKPGSYPLAGKVTVLDAIAEAGGFIPFAKESHIYILRHTAQGKDKRIRFNYKQIIKGKHPEQNILLEPQDTVVVP